MRSCVCGKRDRPNWIRLSLYVPCLFFSCIGSTGRLKRAAYNYLEFIAFMRSLRNRMVLNYCVHAFMAIAINQPDSPVSFVPYIFLARGGSTCRLNMPRFELSSFVMAKQIDQTGQKPPSLSVLFSCLFLFARRVDTSAQKHSVAATACCCCCCCCPCCCFGRRASCWWVPW